MNIHLHIQVWRPVVAAVALLLLLTGCQPLVIEDRDAALTIEIDADALVMTNQRDEPILFQAFPQEMLAAIRWVPCDDASNCPEQVIQPQATKRVDLSEIIQEETTDVTVYWWTLAEAANEDGLRINALNVDELPLP